MINRFCELLWYRVPLCPLLQGLAGCPAVKVRLLCLLLLERMASRVAKAHFLRVLYKCIFKFEEHNDELAYSLLKRLLTEN